MLSLSKKSEYALIALAYLVERPGEVVSAREIALRYDLPQALLMNILKNLNQSGIVRSRRGAKGGYSICANPADASLFDLVSAVDGEVQTMQCAGEEDCRISRRCPVQEPIGVLHHRLMGFLKQVKLSELIKASIGVPLELGTQATGAQT